jgi:AcrR family transcriptional regulator
MTVTAGASHDRAAATRSRLLETAERLIAERGLVGASNRQIAEAAGQANNSAVGYHIGTREDLVLAVMRSHEAPMEQMRARMVQAVAGSTDVYEHVACLVRPLTYHLADLGVPSYFARFFAHIQNDPMLRGLIEGDRERWPALLAASDAVSLLLSHIPAPVARVRSEITRAVIVHTCAEQERSLAQQGGSGTDAWMQTGDALVDAITGLISAPVRPLR